MLERKVLHQPAHVVEESGLDDGDRPEGGHLRKLCARGEGTVLDAEAMIALQTGE